MTRESLLGGKKAAGRVALVDDDDYELVSRYKWHVCARPKKRCTYAITNIWKDERRTTIEMHVLVMGRAGVDHKDFDGLNNQRVNLRFATQQEQLRHTRSYRGSSSRFKGVSWHKGNQRWTAQIRIDGRLRHLGSFTSEEDAARAYAATAIDVHGDFYCAGTV
jgi:hypothetical protein